VGRFDTASAGYRLRAPVARQAQRVTAPCRTPSADAEVAGFHLPVVDSVGVGDAADPVVVVVRLRDGVLLTQGTQVQVASQQLPAVGLPVVLELVVGPPTRLGAAERTGERIEGGTGGTKGVLGQLGQQGVVVAVGLHRALSCSVQFLNTRNLRGRALSASKRGPTR
jgi:hypothetical protein